MSVIHFNWFLYLSVALLYLHLKSHSITIFLIFNSVYLPGDLPLIHEIVPENIPLSLSYRHWVAAIIWNVIVFEHYQRLALSPKISLLTCGVFDPQ